MRPKPVAPERTIEHGPMEGTRETHPAYGMIGANRVNGSAYLFGSEFRHHNYIVVRIHTADTRRSISHDWRHANRELIEVAMSESQWAMFISTLNMGEGAPCTLQAIQGTEIPPIAAPDNKTAQFTGEAVERLQRVKDGIETIAAYVEKSGATKRQKEELFSLLNRLGNDAGPNIAYVGRCFGEYVEQTTDRAKTEIHAYIDSVIQRTGLDALKGRTPFELSGDTEDKEP